MELSEAVRRQALACGELGSPMYADLLARLRAAPLAALDTETTSLDPMVARLVGVSFAIEPTDASVAVMAARELRAEARSVQALPLRKSDRVPQGGTGSGHLTALHALCAAHV